MAKWIYFPEQKQVRVELTTEEKAWIKAHPNIRMGLPENLEPYVMADEQGKLSGILVDFTDVLNRTLGTDIVLTTMPSSRILEMSDNREIDIIYAVEPYIAEQKKLLQTEVWTIGHPAIYAREGISFKTPDDFNGKTVVIRPNTAWDIKLLEPYLKMVKIVYAETPLEAMEMVLSKEADIYLGLTSHSYVISKYRLFGIVQAHIFADTPVPLIMGVRSDWPAFVSILNKGLTHIGKEGLRRIVTKWVQAPLEKKGIELTPEERAWLDKHPAIRVSFWLHPPIFYMKDGKMAGMAVDLLNKITEMTGITFQHENRLDRFSDVLQGLREHKGQGPDLVGALMPTTERKKNILFTEPYFSSPRFIFTRDDAPFVSSIENLFDKNIAVVRDYVTHNTLVEKYPNIDLLVCDNNEEALRAVSLGKAFAFIGDLVATPAMINEFGLKNLKAASPSGLPDHPLAMAMRDDWPELRDIIDKALNAIPADEKAAIINKWSTVRIDYGIRPTDVLKWLLGVLGVASIIVLLFVTWNRQLGRKVRERTAELMDMRHYTDHLVQTANVMITSLDIHGNILNINPAGEKITGFSLSEIKS